MENIGTMTMPENFRYKEVLKKGKPGHDRYDYFFIKHPQMPAGKRAKLFAPFDALRGFSEAALTKQEHYVEKIGLEEEERRILNERLSFLHRMTINPLRNKLLHRLLYLTKSLANSS